MANNYRLKIFPLAQTDLESIFSYIAEELKNPTAAVDQINDFEKAFEEIDRQQLHRVFPYQRR